MGQIPTQRLSLDQFLRLTETEPACEYIDGKVIPKPMPQGEHSVIQGELTARINQVLKPQRIARAFPELRCIFGDQVIVPAIPIFTWDRIPRQPNGRIANTFSLASDWMIEILSADQSQTKLTKKILTCVQNGVPMGWLIVPGDDAVLIYRSDQPVQVCDSSNPNLPVPELAQDLQISVEELFR